MRMCCYALKAMGHGDYLILSDTNFPSDSVARQTVLGKLLRMDNTTSAEAAAAILSLMPLDTFIDNAAERMEVVGSPDEMPDVQQEVQAAIDAAEGKHWPLKSIERFAFYEKAKKAYCVIQTGERRFYGCFVFTKGVIPPDRSERLAMTHDIVILGVFVADTAYRAEPPAKDGRDAAGQRLSARTGRQGLQPGGCRSQGGRRRDLSLQARR